MVNAMQCGAASWALFFRDHQAKTETWEEHQRRELIKYAKRGPGNPRILRVSLTCSSA